MKKKGRAFRAERAACAKARRPVHCQHVQNQLSVSDKAGYSWIPVGPTQ